MGLVSLTSCRCTCGRDLTSWQLKSSPLTCLRGVSSSSNSSSSTSTSSSTSSGHCCHSSRRGRFQSRMSAAPTAAGQQQPAYPYNSGEEGRAQKATIEHIFKPDAGSSSGSGSADRIQAPWAVGWQVGLLAN